MKHLNTILASNEAMNAAFWYIMDNLAEDEIPTNETREILRDLDAAMKECHHHIGTDPWDYDPRKEDNRSIHAG